MNLINQKFGKLTVIEQTDQRDSSRRIIWLCKCNCGNIRLVNTSYLRNGKITSCIDCAKKIGSIKRKDTLSKNIKNDLTGQVFGRLTIIYPLEERSKNRDIIWHCKCRCGNEIDVPYTRLKNGITKSCGCLQDENRVIIGKNNKKDLVGQIFGRLTVLEDSGQRYDNNVLWRCQCECGNKPLIKGTSLLHGVKSCGCLKSKGEARIAELLTENNIPFETQKTFEDCLLPNSNYHAYFDFWVNNKYLIEYDGIQHFEANTSPKSWNTDANLIEVQERDKFKDKWCTEKGITLIRIPYTKLKTLTIEDLLESSYPGE